MTLFYGAFCLLDFTYSLVATDGTIRKSRKNDESLQPKVTNGMQGFWCRLYELVPLCQHVCNHFVTNDYVAKVHILFIYSKLFCTF